MRGRTHIAWSRVARTFVRQRKRHGNTARDEQRREHRNGASTAADEHRTARVAGRWGRAGASMAQSSDSGFGRAVMRNGHGQGSVTTKTPSEKVPAKSSAGGPSADRTSSDKALEMTTVSKKASKPGATASKKRGEATSVAPPSVAPSGAIGRVAAGIAV